ncbi:MAG: hypothetical protein IIU11_06930 [Bacteroidales bacterium]|nr:hypothetical protein [Bacteroidales bacterium]MBR6278516.1 hypothetical protein [Bacteroidales bacterium]
MKRLFLIVLTMVSIFALPSCEGDPGPRGPAGRDGEDGVVFYRKDEYEVLQKDWKEAEFNGSKYFRYEFEYPELTETMCDIGIVNAYILIDDDVTYQRQLPATNAYNVETEEGQSYFYTTVIDYEYAPGVITFYVTNSDFSVDKKPEDMRFRVITHY